MAQPLDGLYGDLPRLINPAGNTTAMRRASSVNRQPSLADTRDLAQVAIGVAPRLSEIRGA
jgi:hypothetical protein